MEKKSVSVVMPVFNAEKYLDVAINSILLQTFKDFEYIIIDDGSADLSWEIIKKYAKKDKRIIALRNKINIRTTKTLNKGIRKAKGKYIVRMDADDWSYPYRIEKQWEFMEKHPEIGVSGGTIEICTEKLDVINKREYPVTDKKIREKIFRYSPFAHPATIWRTGVLRSVGGYNENLPLSQDYELYFRIGKYANFGNLSKTLLKLRTHNDSSSLVKGKYQEQYTIYSRIKAFLELGYNMTFFDKSYTFLQMISMVIIPPKMKFWLFNLLRRER
jgi:glycosyltransferase involved in cell wall biosynthesis